MYIQSYSLTHSCEDVLVSVVGAWIRRGQSAITDDRDGMAEPR